MKLAQKRQSRGGLTFQEDHDDREVRRLHAPIKRFVIFYNLPWPEPLLPDQQHEGRGLGNFLGKLWQPIVAGTQTLRSKEGLSLGVLALERNLEPLHDRKVLRIVAEKPTPHSCLTRARKRRRLPPTKPAARLSAPTNRACRCAAKTPAD